MKESAFQVWQMVERAARPASPHSNWDGPGGGPLPPKKRDQPVQFSPTQAAPKQSAYAEMMALAKDLSLSTGFTLEKAFDRIYQTRPDLVKQYIQEQRLDKELAGVLKDERAKALERVEGR